jgi:serine protease Do
MAWPPFFVFSLLMKVPPMLNTLLLALLLLVPSAPNKAVIERTALRTAEIDWHQDEEHTGHCTGINVGIRWVLTAEHCIPPKGVDIEVNHLVARVVKTDKDLDLALIQTDWDLATIELRKGQTAPGEVVLAIGYAWDEPLIVLHRYVGRVIDEAVFTDGTFIPGMSGGPVVDLDGKLVGMVQRGYEGNIGGAISAKLIKEFLDAR